MINENITHKKKKLKRDKIEDENEAEVNQGWLDVDKNVPYDKRQGDQEFKKDQKFDKREDVMIGGEEEKPKKDLFMADDMDELFGTAQDREIAEKDIPERLQIKLKDRFHPSEEHLREEAYWIFGNITESLEDSKESNQSQKQKIKDIQEKIMKTLSFFKNDQLDVPEITKYHKSKLLPEITPSEVWRIFNLDIEYGNFEVQKKQISDFFLQIKSFSPDNQDILHIVDKIHYIKNHRDLKDYYALVDFYKSYYQKELEQKALESGKKLPVKRIMFVRTAREKKLDELSRRCTLAPSLFVENLNEDKLIHMPKHPQNVQVK